MDYAPQEMGTYDTVYSELSENDCRSCHSAEVGERHHLLGGGCTDCHEIGSPIRDCLTSGCHSENDLFTNGWHHDTDLAASANCIVCHGPNLAHPSTYHHYDTGVGFVGFYEYENPIYNSYDTHHMGFIGDVGSDCAQCHSLDPDAPSWDPLNPELIRYCERCHSPATLHFIHARDFHAWEPVGVHVPGMPEGAPDVYGYFIEDEMCFGCHWPQPTRFVEKVKPRSRETGKVIRIIGYGFGHTQGDSEVHVGGRTFDHTSSRIKFWSYTKIKIRIPKYPCDWFNGEDLKKVKVWVTVNGEDTNKRRLKVLKPAACP
jgi:hypothetical protein